MYLPKSPTDTEKYLYLNQNKYFYYVPGIISGTLLLVGFVLFSLQHYSLLFFLPLVLVLFAYLFISYFIGLSPNEFSLDLHKRVRAIADTGDGYYPSVDIFLPCCGENLSLLKNTYEHVKYLMYFSRYRPNVYVLDDGKSDDVRFWAEKYLFNYIRRETNDLKKAGNLRNAFNLTTGDLIVIFDADFCPRQDFLDETVPYFKDESIAIVQTPQFFDVNSSQTPIERGAGYVQELFYRLIQCNRDRYSASVCVGTNAVYRRAALNLFGGTAAIGYSEDLHTGFNVSKAGFKVKYLPLNLAKGVCPPDSSAFFGQQYRWCMGSITLATNPDFWKSKLSFMQKIAYFSGFGYYVATAIGIVLTPLPALIMLSFFPEKILWFNYVFSIPSLIFSTVVYAYWNKSSFTKYFPVTRFIQSWAHLFALIDKARGDLMPWMTKTTGQNTRFLAFTRMNLLWFITVLLVTVIGLARNISTSNWYHFIPLSLVTSYNLSLSFMTWRLKDAR